MTKQAQIRFVGPFPGPLSGQTIMTQFLFDSLRQASPAHDIKQLNTARGTSGNWTLNMMVKLWRMFAAFFSILAPGPVASIYVSLGANRGMAYSLLHIAGARLKRSPIVVHHHTYAHISANSAAMATVARVAGSDATHLCICDLMAEELQTRYPVIKRTAVLSNIIAVEQNRGIAQPSDRLRLGHISNLSFEKGLRETVDLLADLTAAGIDAELHLAGPASSPAVSTYLDDVATQHGDRITIHGPLYGQAKQDFFASLDMFLFPTHYKNETQGIVILEALAANVPVLAEARCCINSDIGPLPGWAIPAEVDFIPTASAFVQMLMAEGSLPHMKTIAGQRFETLKQESSLQIRHFFDLCRGVS